MILSYLLILLSFRLNRMVMSCELSKRCWPVRVRNTVPCSLSCLRKRGCYSNRMNCCCFLSCCYYRQVLNSSSECCMTVYMILSVSGNRVLHYSECSPVLSCVHIRGSGWYLNRLSLRQYSRYLFLHLLYCTCQKKPWCWKVSDVHNCFSALNFRLRMNFLSVNLSLSGVLQEDYSNNGRDYNIRLRNNHMGNIRSRNRNRNTMRYTDHTTMLPSSKGNTMENTMNNRENTTNRYTTTPSANINRM